MHGWGPLGLFGARFQELVSTTLQPDFTPDGHEITEAPKANIHAGKDWRNKFMLFLSLGHLELKKFHN